jgi:hypothetical protein
MFDHELDEAIAAIRGTTKRGRRRALTPGEVIALSVLLNEQASRSSRDEKVSDHEIRVAELEQRAAQ